MRPLEVYIHIPFCVKKCAYCDFLSFPADRATQDAYVDMLQKEILQWKDRRDYQVSTVFFGGGTPSLLAPEKIGLLMDTLRGAFAFEQDAEISIECNPGTLSREKARGYRAAGLNRVSLGLQSVREKELALLGRIHSYEDFLESLDCVRDAGFSNVNVDLMSGLPGQSLAAWEDTLETVAKLRPEHISAYSLIVEEGTPFFERYGEEAEQIARGEQNRFLPSEETERRMYAAARDILGDWGYQRYEISNYALPGFACRHNCGYWERKEYKGFGLGAASLIADTRTSNTEELACYLRGEWEAAPAQALSAAEQMEETMFLGLRMDRGVDIRHFRDAFGISVDKVYGEILAKLEGERLIRREGNCLKLTDKGVDISNYVLAQFLL